MKKKAAIRFAVQVDDNVTMFVTQIVHRLDFGVKDKLGHCISTAESVVGR